MNEGDTITVQIGSGEAVTYRAVDTTAPKVYDGFGTIEIMDAYDDARTVLIREEHYTWQTQRYASGMKAFNETIFDEEQIVEELWKRITKGTES